MDLDSLKKHRKNVVKLRDRLLSEIAAAEDQRTTGEAKEGANSLLAILAVVDAEIGILRAIKARLEDVRIGGKH